jgi:putative ABC transport system ATP-binding protein
MTLAEVRGHSRESAGLWNWSGAIRLPPTRPNLVEESSVKRILSWLRAGSHAAPGSVLPHAAPGLHPPCRQTVLRARGLTHAFGTGEGRALVLHHIDLDLRRGQLVLLMGPSGSGKSTLLAALSGLLRPEAGSVVIQWTDLWALSPREREQFRLKHFGFIFQGYNLFPALNARQQLEIVLRWGHGVSGKDARRRADALLARLGLAHKGHLRPAQLSGGEKQRVAIGRALVKDPAFCFADEPTSALDWEHGREVVHMLREAAHERGATVLVVTHDARLLPYADRVFHLADGRLCRQEGSTPRDRASRNTLPAPL